MRFVGPNETKKKRQKTITFVLEFENIPITKICFFISQKNDRKKTDKKFGVRRKYDLKCRIFLHRRIHQQKGKNPQGRIQKMHTKHVFVFPLPILDNMFYSLNRIIVFCPHPTGAHLGLKESAQQLSVGWAETSKMEGFSQVSTECP